jgi:hypothetical protein
MKEKVTTKIWKDTLYKLKLVAVLSQSKMLEVLDRLISQELDRLKKEETNATSREAPDQQD